MKSIYTVHLIAVVACLGLYFALGAACGAEKSRRVWHEEFEMLDAWKPLTLPKIAKHTRYTVTNLEGRVVLKADADDSASGLVCTNIFNPYDRPILRWRWRVENVLAKGDATRKDGDDYPLRVYILFSYDPEKASLGMRTQYAIARKLYGEYPPHASLNYIWANRKHDQLIVNSPYTERSKMIILQAGKERLGEWIEEEVNILDDYRAAFGEDSPKSAHLAVMSDADNTRGTTTAFLDFIELDTLSTHTPEVTE